MRTSHSRKIKGHPYIEQVKLVLGNTYYTISKYPADKQSPQRPGTNHSIRIVTVALFPVFTQKSLVPIGQQSLAEISAGSGSYFPGLAYEFGFLAGKPPKPTNLHFCSSQSRKVNDLKLPKNVTGCTV